VTRFIPWAAAGLFFLWFAGSFAPLKPVDGFEMKAYAALPVLNAGRVKPVESLARNSLLLLSGKQTLRLDGGRKSADAWLLDVMFKKEAADAHKVFKIDDPDVLGLLGKEQTARYYSFKDLEPSLETLAVQSDRAQEVKPERRNRFQTAVVNLQNRIILYQKLQNTVQVGGALNTRRELAEFQAAIEPAAKALADHQKNPKLTPALARMTEYFQRYQFLDQAAAFFAYPRPGAEDQWMTPGEAFMERIKTGELHPGLVAFAAMGDAYRAGETKVFNIAAAEYKGWLSAHFPSETAHAAREALFNRVEPFYKSLVMYVGVFLLVLASWLVRPKELNRAAFLLLLLTFAIHTGGLIARMILQGRPPVTNLYSSAIFVGWVAVLLGIVLERLYKNGIGALASAVIGFTTLIIAHHLATQGDTLEMMRAVLDSNFWLATHVVTITVGYGATFLSGFLGILYILRERFTRSFSEESARNLARMAYGVVCFSTLLSFIGTILGGIWADQSWGRFWGWDPKENGALMIVLWNALVLHARWGGFVRQRGFMTLTVFGNVITALSWFGVNMLGIGLHSYGFMDKAFWWLAGFVVSQIALIALGLLPPRAGARETARAA